MIIIHAGFQVKADKEQAFLKDIRILIEASRKEAGNVRYDLMKDTEKEAEYTMVEVWEDQKAIEVHNSSAHFAEFMGKAAEFLAAPLNVKLYEANELKR